MELVDALAGSLKATNAYQACPAHIAASTRAGSGRRRRLRRGRPAPPRREAGWPAQYFELYRCSRAAFGSGAYADQTLAPTESAP